MRPLNRPMLFWTPQSNILSIPVLLLLVATWLFTAAAQTITPPFGTSASQTALSTSFTKVSPLSSMSNDSFGAGSVAASTTGPLFSRPTSNDSAPDTSSSQDTDDDDGINSSHSGLINYYFVFLALFIILAFLGVYFLNRRRRARKLAYRNSGQNALARDVNGWVSNARRWQWRNDSRNVEGLNELGQAPPAYSAKADSEESSREGAIQHTEPQIPLRSLARYEEGQNAVKPPEYFETLRADSAAEPHTARPPSPPQSLPPAHDGGRGR